MSAEYRWSTPGFSVEHAPSKPARRPPKSSPYYQPEYAVTRHKIGEPCPLGDACQFEKGVAASSPVLVGVPDATDAATWGENPPGGRNATASPDLSPGGGNGGH